MWQTTQGLRPRHHPWRMAVLASTLSLLLLIPGSLGLALVQAREAERQALAARSERFLLRVEQVFGQLRQVLERLEQQPLRKCDPAMQALLAQIDIEHRFVQEVIFTEGKNRCSSRPQQRSPQPRRAADVQLPPYRYWLDTAHEPEGDRAALVLARGPFHVFTSRAHLRDMIDLSDGSSLYLLPRGGTQALPILGAEQAPPQARASADGAAHSDLNVLDGRMLYRMSGMDPAYELALVAPGTHLYQRTRRAWLIWLPGSLALALLVGLLTYLQRRHVQSPQKRLQTALDRRELQVRYQPIVDLASRRCIGAEALIRWCRPDGSLISPELFIPLAESTGQIRQITDFLLQQVLEQLSELLREHPAFYISINLAACDVSVPRVGDLTERLLAQHRIAPGQIAFEITERGLVDLGTARDHLAELRARGHRVLIDDFGTGYANLAYLQELPVDGLKIDRAFVTHLSVAAGSCGVASHIIRMARDLQIKVIAEGIEHEEQAHLLHLEGADCGQGWLFAPPLGATQLHELIRQGCNTTLTRVA